MSFITWFQLLIGFSEVCQKKTKTQIAEFWPADWNWSGPRTNLYIKFVYVDDVVRL